MTKDELKTIFALQAAVITAPAGHGKTEMIVDLVEYADGKQLLLTHTHAGVDALQKRLDRRSISKSKYTISTIAAFCAKWGTAYPYTSEVDVKLTPNNTKEETKRYYLQFYDGAAKLFEHVWAGKILKISYSGVIVDEYQDCMQSHHKMFQIISQHLPVRVFGDPLQGIFSFGGQQLVDWNHLEYSSVDVDSSPWRWIKTNPKLGQYLQNIRNDLLPTLSGLKCNVNINSCNGCISVIDPRNFNLFSMHGELKQFNSVLYVTKWEKQQIKFCKSHTGIFQFDEKQECEDLFKFARSFSNKSGTELFLEIIKFENECATGVNTKLVSYINRLKKGSFDFGRITKHKEFGQFLTDMQKSEKHETILCALKWFEKNPNFKYYRRELHCEMVRSVKYAREHGLSIYEAAERIRKDPALQKRYQGFKYLSSRTLLSKGLEFDCVIIDMSTHLSAKEFYVALTRAMKKIYILSPSNFLTLNP